MKSSTLQGSQMGWWVKVSTSRQANFHQMQTKESMWQILSAIKIHATTICLRFKSPLPRNNSISIHFTNLISLIISRKLKEITNTTKHLRKLNTTMKMKTLLLTMTTGRAKKCLLTTNSRSKWTKMKVIVIANSATIISLQGQTKLHLWETGSSL